MHHVIDWTVVVVVAVVIGGCADVAGPNPRRSDDSTPITDGARRLPRPPSSLPDSVGIPPMPVPPIHEGLPPILDAPQ